MANKLTEMVGKKFGSWTVLERGQSDKHRHPKWLCRCICGITKEVKGSRLREGKSNSCGCQKSSLISKSNTGNKSPFKVDILGQRFGRLIVIKQLAETKDNGKAVWLCQCDCGKTSKTTGKLLRTGHTKSCGCLGAENRANSVRTHGQSGTRQYKNSIAGKRRASKRNATPKWADLEKIREIYNNCPEGFDVDHIIPLKGEKYGICGLHTESNLQYLPSSENGSKSNFFIPCIMKRPDFMYAPRK